MYQKVKELLGIGYQIVKVYGTPLKTQTYQQGSASPFSVQIDFISVDELSQPSTVHGVIPREIAEILQKLFEIS